MMNVDYHECEVRCMESMNITDLRQETRETYMIYSCCFSTCYLEKMGFIADGEYVATGMVSSFGASVDFDTSWMNVIESSVKRCFDTTPMDLKYDCDQGLSNEFLQVMQCTFIQVSCKHK